MQQKPKEGQILAEEKLSVHPSARCLIFDVDGTLADTLSLHHTAWDLAFAKFGVEYPKEFFNSFGGMPAEAILLKVNEVFKYNLDIAKVASAKEDAVFAILEQATAIPETVAIVRSYHRVLPIGLASGGSRKNVERTLELIGLAEAFGLTLTADDPVPPKPSPEIFLTIARHFDVPPKHCQVFEDGNAGIQAAKEAGMIVTDVREYGILPRLLKI